MPTLIKYIGTSPISELSITGKPGTWQPGEIQSRSDADAALFQVNGNWKTVSASSLIPDGSTPVSATRNLDGGIGISAMLRAIQRPSTTQGKFRPYSVISSAVSAGYTISTQQQFAGPVEAIQFNYSNYSASPYTVSAAGVIQVATDMDATGTGTPVLAATLPTLAAASGTGNDVVPTYGSTEVLPIRSVNSLNLFQTRSYFAAAASAAQVSSANFAAYCIKTGLLLASKASSGDLVTTWSALAAYTRASSSWWAPHETKAFYSVPSRTVAVAGDSIRRGQGSAGGHNGAAQLATRRLTLSMSSTVIDFANHAITGQKFAPSMQTARNVVQTFRPDVIVIHSWSPNDGAASQAVFDAAWANLLNTLDVCRQYGTEPIVVTSIPWNTLDAAQSIMLRAYNARVLTLRNQFLVVDSWSAYFDPANPDKIRADYDSGGGLHPNDAGYQAESLLFDESLKIALGIVR